MPGIGGGVGIEDGVGGRWWRRWRWRGGGGGGGGRGGGGGW